MAAPLPASFREAITLAYRVSAVLGEKAESLINSLWGDPGQIREVARSWGDAKRRIDSSIRQITDDLSTLDKQSWDGDAKEEYADWMKRLIEEQLKPISESFGEMDKATYEIAEILDNELHDELASVVEWFKTALEGLLAGAAGAGAAGVGTAAAAGAAAGTAAAGATIGPLVILGLASAFAYRIYQVHHAYTTRFRHYSEAMDVVKKKEIHVREKFQVQIIPGVKLPMGVERIGHRLRGDILFDWDNWENKDPKSSGKVLPPQDYTPPQESQQKNDDHGVGGLLPPL